ncbi:Fc.00g115330.m01.CDS01 [Cosmosporella sp. VM-42]
MALEALGSGMIVCPERIDEGMSALDGKDRFEHLKATMVTLGLRSDGIANFIRKTAKRCVPAFLLATSLKTFLGDEEIGNVFYEMLACQGLSRKPELNWWQEATAISQLVVVDTTFDGLPPKPPSFLLASIAKETLRAQYQLSEIQITQVGMVATALVLVATERGLVTTEAAPKGAPREVKLLQICQSAYLSRVTESMVCYGWTAEQVQGAEQFATEIKGCTERFWEIVAVEAVSAIDVLINAFTTISNRLGIEISSEVVEAAIYVAMESLYSSMCSQFATQRFFRVGDFSSIASSSAFMLHLVSEDEERPWHKNSWRPRQASPITLRELRCNCMASLLPGASAVDSLDKFGEASTSESVNRRDLAYSVNGYVAWLPQLRAISTISRDAMAIEVKAGYIRCKAAEIDDQALLKIRADGCYEIDDEDNAEPPPVSSLHPFDAQGNYTGLQRFTDKDGLQVKHYWHQASRVLRLRAGIFHPATGRTITVDWIRAIEASASATHLTNQYLAGFAEKTLAETWKAENIWSSISLLSVVSGTMPSKSGGESLRNISRTYGDEALRFFYAGNVPIHKLYICHGSCSVVKCIQIALEDDLSIRAKWREIIGRSMEEPTHSHYSGSIVVPIPKWLIVL